MQKDKTQKIAFYVQLHCKLSELPTLLKQKHPHSQPELALKTN